MDRGFKNKVLEGLFRICGGQRGIAQLEPLDLRGTAQVK